MKRIAFMLIMFLGFVCSFGQSTDLWHVEPPMWWTGMNNPELQIMLHGENISLYEARIDYPGVILIRTSETDNPNYLFLYVNILPDATPGIFDIILNFKTDGKKKRRSGDLVIPYELRERREGSANREGFSTSDVMYLITPDRFVNGDPENDSVEGMEDKLNRDDLYGRHGGDLEGLIGHLDYIADMGFSAIWLNPVVENDMPRASYHGYAITDYYNIDARYGTNDDYLRLCKEAEKRGIKIIMDQIMNHCGLSHWWMKDLPADDWINSKDEYKQTSHKRVVLHDPYVAESDKVEFTDGWFVPSMPDLNQRNALLADYLIQNSIWWVEFANLGGIRHDTQPYAGKEFMSDYSCRIMDEYPNFNIVGEEWSLNPAVIAKWQKGMVNPDNYVSCMPSLFDFPLQNALVESLIEDESWNKGWIKVYEMLSNDFLYADPFQLVIFPDNHDMDRIFTQLNQDYDLFKMAMVYTMTMRGIPQIYYGTEILLSNTVKGNHGQIREDFPGGWPGDQKNGFTGNNLSEESADARVFMKKLLNWRKGEELIHNGQLMHYAPVDGVYTYFRYNNNQKIMVAFNKSKKKVQLNQSDYPEQLSKSKTGVNPLNGEKHNLNNLTIPSRSYLILKIQ